MVQLTGRSFVAALVLACVSLPVGRAEAGLGTATTFSQLLLGCGNSSCVTHSTNTTAQVLNQDANNIGFNFGLNVNASAGTGTVTENGAGSYTASFNVSSSGNYSLLLEVDRDGELRRDAIPDGCEGSVSLAAMSAPTITFSGTPGALSQVVFPGADIADGSGAANQQVDMQVSRVLVLLTNRPQVDNVVLTFKMSATAVSNSCPVSARFGAPNLETMNCSACDYPGDGNRDIDNDGLKVFVNFKDSCGDESIGPGEQCDIGPLNGAPGVCCDSRCQLLPYGTACADDGQASTSDICDGMSGRCQHLTAAALCGNGHLDAGENCDDGSQNGTAGTCCTTDCKARSTATHCTSDGNPCTDDVCDGTSGNCTHIPDTNVVCRSINGPCDVFEFCAADGSCPPDGKRPPGTVCDVFSGPCVTGLCDTNGQCVETPNPGESCDDGVFCNGADHCGADGSCSVHDSQPCQSTQTCDEANKKCVGSCLGDCDGDGQVEINELVLAVSIALETTNLSACPVADGNGDGSVTIDEILTAVNNALGACTM